MPLQVQCCIYLALLETTLASDNGEESFCIGTEVLKRSRDHQEHGTHNPQSQQPSDNKGDRGRSVFRYTGSLSVPDRELVQSHRLHQNDEIQRPTAGTVLWPWGTRQDLSAVRKPLRPTSRLYSDPVG